MKVDDLIKKLYEFDVTENVIFIDADEVEIDVVIEKHPSGVIFQIKE